MHEGMDVPGQSSIRRHRDGPRSIPAETNRAQLPHRSEAMHPEQGNQPPPPCRLRDRQAEEVRRPCPLRTGTGATSPLRTTTASPTSRPFWESGRTRYAGSPGGRTTPLPFRRLSNRVRGMFIARFELVEWVQRNAVLVASDDSAPYSRRGPDGRGSRDEGR